MISELEFKKALKIVAAYKLQLEQDSTKRVIDSRRSINIQNEISEYAFRALSDYYLHEFEIVLERSDLKLMDVRLLSHINYEKLKAYRGFGKVKYDNFKKLMISLGILDIKDTTEIKN